MAVGIHKLGDNQFNRNWQISQGSIIASAGAPLADIHPFVVEGQGHTAVANCESFSGGNSALTTVGKSQDFMLVQGSEPLTVSLVGCRMRNYAADSPISVGNPAALIQAVACVDEENRPYNETIRPE